MTWHKDWKTPAQSLRGTRFFFLLGPHTPMIVTTKALWLAVHRTLSDAGVLRTGQGMGVKQMMHVWSLTGLRQRDLGNALDSLARAGFVKLTTDANGPRAELLDASFGLLDSRGRDTNAVATLKHFRELRGRPPYLAGIAQDRKEGRRREDRMTAPVLAKAG
ncbi:hypothetical protein DFR24_0251 [Panacagrimonas perspica]|uniref:Uncharacterized protein n=2 Tax=Panacagrimonas perspica TaxID=381431 RepID=A0A4R7PA45_9GAMM|nr:hypothetical protein DFR24_0251 [Panacagrimonas perspica]